MDINELFKTSVSRAERWHPGGIEEWSPLEWAGAMCGEAGEAANFAKKLLRVQTSMRNIDSSSIEDVSEEQLKWDVANEACDTILYALLLMARVGIQDPAFMLRNVFNAKSQEYGFPERV